ncbi:uncharacterized protein LOC127260432 [Andrographis paniculata]|uniref:uncharacterized protein LOC127260432 n=1 Tax=Andrographis paniculata TaxID=175694 RepID=UPI0021E99F74|nr:uncharacterized protein LOC127260432 [Andrographis paniculata]
MAEIALTSPQNNNNEDEEKPPIAPPYPWATDRRAVVHSFIDLRARSIVKISGEVECKNCGVKYDMELDSYQTYFKIKRFFADNIFELAKRAPKRWTHPVAMECRGCRSKSLRAVVAEKKKNINWLFLLLTEMVGLCRLDQLKYFCKHNNVHRTGAKDRLLFLVYLGLGKQFDPEGPYEQYMT